MLHTFGEAATHVKVSLAVFEAILTGALDCEASIGPTIAAGLTDAASELSLSLGYEHFLLESYFRMWVHSGGVLQG